MEDIKIKTFGFSMFPFFLDGDVLNVKKTSFRNINVDDFITFKRKDRYITHRVIYKNEKAGFVITKGDSNISHDGKVPSKKIIGKVSSLSRSGMNLNTDDLYLFQSSVYFQEISKVNKIFTRKKIKFVFLKGLPLHLYFEGRTPKRIYADCDILIDKYEFKAVDKILRKLGYKAIKSGWETTAGKFKTKTVEISYQKIINGIPVIFDLHLEAAFLMTQIGDLEYLYKQKNIDGFTALLLNNAYNIKMNEESFPVLRKELLIIYLALHIFHHNFQGYNRYTLLLAIIKSRKVNYEFITAILAQWKLMNYVFPVFLIIQKHYGIKTPLSKLSLKTPVKRYVLRKILPIDIFNEEDRISSGIRRFRNIYLLSEEKPYKKILVFASPEVMLNVIAALTKKLKSFYLRNYFILFQNFDKRF
jgi:hypothetical protein